MFSVIPWLFSLAKLSSDWLWREQTYASGSCQCPTDKPYLVNGQVIGIITRKEGKIDEPLMARLFKEYGKVGVVIKLYLHFEKLNP
jgi:C1A family cysteine protease